MPLLLCINVHFPQRQCGSTMFLKHVFFPLSNGTSEYFTTYSVLLFLGFIFLRFSLQILRLDGEEKRREST